MCKSLVPRSVVQPLAISSGSCRSTHPYNTADPDTNDELNRCCSYRDVSDECTNQYRELGISETDTRGNPINVRDVYVGVEVSGSDVVNGTTIVAVDCGKDGDAK